MTKTRTIIVIVIAIAVAIGLSIPLVGAYSASAGGQQGYFGWMMGRGFGQPYPPTAGYGPGGMMGGYYGGGASPGGYGRGMMGGGMMGGAIGGYGGSYYGMMTTQGLSIPISQAIQNEQSPPAYAQIDKSNDTISFQSLDISIVALAMMPDKAINITGMQPPSYSSDDVFVIYGLINPTLVIQAGATVQFTIVNLDDDMYHNLVVSSFGPPYPYMAMQGMMSYQQNFQGNAYYAMNTMLPFLPPANYDSGSAHEYSYSTTFNQAGTLWYLCTYPGHAQSGMYGSIIVD
ncbi:MAG: hypothetical protein JRN20_16465 [Nitrososphaerota archaeon]|nr:hypothetical protein [Nitrososphaerota archaeon]